MRHWWLKFHKFIVRWRAVYSEELIALILVMTIFIAPFASATRFENRSLFMQSALPGATTSYTISFRYMSPQPVGSIDILFCESPIPYEACVVPPGLDVSGAVLSSQMGEDDFTILSQSVNHIVLTRSPHAVANPNSIYTFTNVKNPTNTSMAFAARLKSLSSTDATGTQIDFGSVRGQVTPGIELETQVPPMLVFCVAEEVHDDCSGTNEIYFKDMGDLGSGDTLTARSQMAVGTNASAGFAITANGSLMVAGTNVIDSPNVPTDNKPGTNQFGINLVENSIPSVGDDPEGTWANAVPSSDYGQTNKFKYVPGDIVAYSPNVSLMRKFTVSYILNADRNLRAGVYTTTINYIASGRF